MEHIVKSSIVTPYFEVGDKCWFRASVLKYIDEGSSRADQGRPLSGAH